MTFLKSQILLCTLMSLTLCTFAQKDNAKQWSQFRGPLASGIIESVNLPMCSNNKLALTTP